MATSGYLLLFPNQYSELPTTLSSPFTPRGATPMPQGWTSPFNRSTTWPSVDEISDARRFRVTLTSFAVICIKRPRPVAREVKREVFSLP